MKPTLRHAAALPFVLSVVLSLLLSACSTAHVSTHTTAPANTLSDARGPAAADEPLIAKFIDALVDKSSLGSQEAVEDAVTQVVNDNASRLSIARIDSLDDIASMSDAEQRRIIDELATLPELSEKLALDSEAVNVARGEAMAAQDVKGVATESVPDLRASRPESGASDGSGDSGDGPNFSKFLERSPAMRGDVTLMLKENADIQQKTGAAVLGKGCGSLENEDSVENVVTMLGGVDRDVAAGKATDTPSVSKSLENNMEDVLGTDAKESHQRICTLSDSRPCAVFSPQMCN